MIDCPKGRRTSNGLRRNSQAVFVLPNLSKVCKENCVKSIAFTLLLVPLLATQVFGQSPILKPYPKGTVIAAPTWRLAGMIHLPSFERVVLTGRWQNMPLGPELMEVGQSNSAWGLTLVSVDYARKTAEATIRGAPLHLASGDAGREEGTFCLHDASLDTVLVVYQSIVNRTILRPPEMPDAVFDLTLDARDKEDASRGIEKYLAARDIATIPNGSTFRMVVPKKMEAMVAAECGRRRIIAPFGKRDIAYNFPAIPLDQMTEIYAQLRKCHLDGRPDFVPGNITVKLRTARNLSREEALYALETLLNWSGVGFVSEPNNMLKPVPLHSSQ